MKLSNAIKSLMFEAYRRNSRPLDYCEKSKSLNQRWLGLGTAAAYRPVLNAGLMMFHDGRIPPQRCMGWLVLTDEGVKVFNKLSNEFEVIMKELNENTRYKESYAAMYMLAGGITS